MLIEIDDKHRVTIDSSHQNLILEQLQPIKDRKTGEIKHDWVTVGQHGLSFRSVLIQYSKVALVDDKTQTTIKEFINKLEQIDKTIQEVVSKNKLNITSKSND